MCCDGLAARENSLCILFFVLYPLAFFRFIPKLLEDVRVQAETASY